MLPWGQVALAGLAGGLLTLERRAFLQAMLSRPLVAATLVGAVLDDVTSGLYVGMVLELFLLGNANLGAAVPEHETLVATGTAAGAASLAISGQGSSPEVWSFALLLFIGLGRLGRFIDRRLERYALRVARHALESAEAGDLRRVMRQNLWAMWPTFLVFGGLTSLCAVIGYELGPKLQTFPPELRRGLAWAYPAMASVAAAIAARGSHSRRAALYAGIAAATVAVVALVLELVRGGRAG